MLKAYLVRAVRDWALDNGFTPHVLVNASAPDVSVPAGYIEDGRIVLNIHPRAVEHFLLEDDLLRFSARFGAQSLPVEMPLTAVLAVYARENGQGISFSEKEGANGDDREGTRQQTRKPRLKVVK